MIDFEFIRAFGWALGLAANLLVLWIGWSLRKKFVTHEDFSAHHEAEVQHRASTSERLAKHDASLTRLDDRVSALPSKESMHNLALQLASIQGEMRGMRDIMERVENQSNLLLREHMEKK